MKFLFTPSLEKYSFGDLLIFPFWEGPKEAAPLGFLKKKIDKVVGSGDFKGKKGEALLQYIDEGRLLLLGLGKKEEASLEALRRAYAAAAKAAHGKKAAAIGIVFPDLPASLKQEGLEAAAEGIILSNYAFSYSSKEPINKQAPLIDSVDWIGVEAKEKKRLEKVYTVAQGVYFVRDLVNGNSDEITPEALKETALTFSKEHPTLKATAFDKKWIEKEKMGLLLAVNQGSSLDPYFIRVDYKGNPQAKEHYVLVGKGITYDTGGLSLKPTEGMMDMKADMAGAATVLGVIKTLAALEIKVNVTALVPTTDNAIGPKSYKLGDVYRSFSGKTVEITNTDAEGRLVLADAIGYAVEKIKPTAIIDLATLTGAAVISLGEEIASLFSNDEKLSHNLFRSSEKTGEMIWKMPLYQDYFESYRSDIADFCNSKGKEASSMKAALFLEQFVEGVKWAHLDIAGPAYWSKPKFYHPTKATGFGLRLLIDFFESLA